MLYQPNPYKLFCGGAWGSEREFCSGELEKRGLLPLKISKIASGEAIDTCLAHAVPTTMFVSGM